MGTANIIMAALFLIVIIYIVAQVIMKPIKLLWKIIINSAIGLVLLMVANYLAGYIDFNIPINIITFGLLSWFINVIVLYLLTMFVPDVSVQAWRFPGVSVAGFVVPPLSFSYVVSLILVSLSVTFFANLLHDISEH